MKYWDSSALVTLFVEEASSVACRRLVRADRMVATWVLTRVEITSALRGLERESPTPVADVAIALRRLALMQPQWTHVTGLESVSERASQLLGAHAISAADALQLSAALEWAEDRPGGRSFVTLDTQLAAAALRVGFDVIEPR